MAVVVVERLHAEHISVLLHVLMLRLHTFSLPATSSVRDRWLIPTRFSHFHLRTSHFSSYRVLALENQTLLVEAIAQPLFW